MSFLILLTEEDLLILKHQIKQEVMSEIEPNEPTYKQLADKVFREKFRELFIPADGNTPQLSYFESKIRGLAHEIRKRKHPEHIFHSPPPILTKDDCDEAIKIYSDLLDFLADHFEMRANTNRHPVRLTDG